MFTVSATYLGKDRLLGDHIVDKEFATFEAAAEFALRANCKAFQPYFFRAVRPEEQHQSAVA